jgi:hypothetical protein
MFRSLFSMLAISLIFATTVYGQKQIGWQFTVQIPSYGYDKVWKPGPGFNFMFKNGGETRFIFGLGFNIMPSRDTLYTRYLTIPLIFGIDHGFTEDKKFSPFLGLKAGINYTHYEIEDLRRVSGNFFLSPTFGVKARVNDKINCEVFYDLNCSLDSREKQFLLSHTIGVSIYYVLSLF